MMVNKQLDPENDTFLMETNLPTRQLPGSMLIYQRVIMMNNSNQEMFVPSLVTRL